MLCHLNHHFALFKIIASLYSKFYSKSQLRRPHTELHGPFALFFAFPFPASEERFQLRICSFKLTRQVKEVAVI